MHTIYEVAIAWTISDNSGHPNWVEIPNSSYVPKGCERLISPQHWAQNATSANADSTNLYGTPRITHHDCATLIWDSR